MCGISGGIFRHCGPTPPYQLAEIAAAQSMRGPDATGFIERKLNDGRSLWLAHNRLSIVDLSTDANQPMLSADGRYALVFNGRIYNYLELRIELVHGGCIFRTSSDTEVLLQAFATWGHAAFDRLHGMFAAAIHDAERGTLTLFRDRFGVKPLYYHETPTSFRFASTPGVMARQTDAEPNLEYVGRGIRLKYYDDETSIAPFEGIRALPPGHYVTIDLRNAADIPAQPYYNLTDAWRQTRQDIVGSGRGELGQELLRRLELATQIRLRADVPIGISLSSGVDSTTVAALCSRNGTNITGFCFGDPSDQQSEAPAVRSFAASLGQQVEFIAQAEGARAKSLFWQTLRAQGAPFPHTSQIAQFAVFEAARASGIKVMLGGQGGDEAFMGYRKFFLFQLRYLLRQHDLRAVPAMIRNIVEIFPAIASKASLFWRERGRYRASDSEGLGSGLMMPPLSSSPSPGAGIGEDPALRQQLDVVRYSLPSLLRYEDRNSMGNSIESRLPFLDHRVIEFGIALPTAAKLHKGMGKYLLRDAVRGIVPDAILFNRDKRGFDTRHADWVASGIGAAIREGMAIHGSRVGALLPAGCRPDEYFSDTNLSDNASRFAEATSVLWLLDPSLESYPV
jgi:asparagine synthase (glutamine-hydrolysing)